MLTLVFKDVKLYLNDIKKQETPAWHFHADLLPKLTIFSAFLQFVLSVPIFFSQFIYLFFVVQMHGFFFNLINHNLLMHRLIPLPIYKVFFLFRWFISFLLPKCYWEFSLKKHTCIYRHAYGGIALFYQSQN